jgi:hypothetical protein
MSDKSSWVSSRTQGFVLTCCCRWPDVLRVLHQLSLSCYGGQLDQWRGHSLCLIYLLLLDWSRTSSVIELSVCELDLNYLLPLFHFELGTVITLYLNSDVFKLRANFMYHVNGECWTTYDLGWDVEKFEILRDFTDYRVYADSSIRIQLLQQMFFILKLI